ncbi:MAG: 4'-phosphopantetheinyl transferase family protein [Solirubrobacteraceae bacterium]
MSAGQAQRSGLGDAVSWQRDISVEGWRVLRLNERSQPVLADGELHIWSTDLEQVPRTGGAHPDRLSVLSDLELDRARRMIRPHARRRWLASRDFLRSLLAGYLEQDPRHLAFSTLDHGKPVLAERTNRALHFNLSHSGRLAICALSRMCAVGVDVQLAPSSANARHMARRLLGAEQTAGLDRLPPGERDRHALRAWAALEAESKRTGVGLGGGERFSGPHPWVAQLKLDEAGAGAVTLALPPSRIGVGTWRSDTFSDYWIYSRHND